MSKFNRVATKNRQTNSQISAAQWQKKVLEYQQALEVYATWDEMNVLTVQDSKRRATIQQKFDALMAENPFEAV